MRLPSSPWLRAGSVLFVVGTAAIVADLVRFLAGRTDSPLWLNLICLVAPVGFAICAWSAFRSGRAEQRAALRELGDG